jgi:outer membrane protein assembly factor BamA
VLGGQVPSITGYSRMARRDDSGAEPTIVRESLVSQQFHRQLSGLAMYPFSRAQRVEFSAGIDHIGYRSDLTTSVYSATTGSLLAETEERRNAAAPTTLLQTEAALVFDTAVHGPTSPVLGSRYRFAVAPTFGGLKLTTLVADYRKYMMPVRPFTLAVRVQHIGRYGPDAGDGRLLPFVWLVQDVVRGYGGRGLPQSRCDFASAACEILDAALTRRLVAANVELRFPILGALKGTSSAGSLPVEGVLFSDAGAFWSPSPTDANARTILRSVGAGVRVNAAGFVFEFDVSHPFNDPQQGWRFGVGYRPGF